MRLRIVITPREWIIYLLIFLGYYKTVLYQIASMISLLQYLLMAAAAVYILVTVFYKSNLSGFNTIIIGIFIFLGMSLCASLWTASEVYLKSKETEVLITAVYCLIIFMIGGGINIKYFLQIICGINTTGLMIYSIINRSSVWSGGLTRLGNLTGDNPIWVCRLCCETLLAMIILDFGKNRRIRSPRIVQYLFILFIAAKTQSKGPIVAFLAALIVMGSDRYMSDQIKQQFKMWVRCAGVIGILLMLVNWNKVLFLFQSRVVSAFANAEGYRVNFYTYTIDAIKDKPIWGYGLASWPLYYWKQDFFAYPHNIILETWFEIGLFSVICLLVVIVKIYKHYYNNNSVSYRVWTVFFTCGFVSALFSGSLYGGNREIYIYGMLLGVNYWDKEDRLSGWFMMHD